MLMVAAAYAAGINTVSNAEVFFACEGSLGRGTLRQTIDAIVPTAPVGRPWLMPRWIMVGILARETRSRLDDIDRIEYVDQRRGASGERGPTQIMRTTFEQYAKPGERFWMVEGNTQLALDITERILVDHKRVLGTWEQAIKAYNAGRAGRKSKAAAEYYHDVRRLADK